MMNTEVNNINLFFIKNIVEGNKDLECCNVMLEGHESKAGLDLSQYRIKLPLAL